MSERRPVMAVVGSGPALCDPGLEETAARLGRAAVDAGFRVATGGLGGVMNAASEGARQSARWHDGAVLAIVPSYDRRTATAHADVVIATGQEIARNVVLVASADVIVALGGGAGTLSEMAIAWQLQKPIIALAGTGGWAEELAGRAIDARAHTIVHPAENVARAVELARELVAAGSVEPGAIGSGWKGTSGS